MSLSSLPRCIQLGHRCVDAVCCVTEGLNGCLSLLAFLARLEAIRHVVKRVLLVGLNLLDLSLDVREFVAEFFQFLASFFIHSRPLVRGLDKSRQYADAAEPLS